MARWQPEARARLERAAMELFTERGFDQTTVAEIAARAGLTERTFFRHYADKREVLFGGSSGLSAELVQSVAGAPAGATPIDMIAASLATAGELFAQRLSFARQRQRIIDANRELQERELIKLAALAASLAQALRERGVADAAALLAAEAGVAVFKIAFGRWIDENNAVPLSDIMRESLAELKAVTAGTKDPFSK
jgi:AcrR family transcriptional regulator